MTDISHRAESSTGSPTISIFFPPPDEGGRHAAHQSKNFENKKYSEDEQISPRRSALFMNGRKPKRLPLKTSIPKKLVHVSRFRYERIFKIPNVADAQSHS